ncbi:MAG: hypothetical protein J5725_11935, partial [Bacteroidales bacterium]|nr:hypothetical protein [Bacteroidales bacterium]
MADGKIEFKLSADTKDALKKLNEARQRFVKIGASLEAVNAKIKQFEDMQMRAASTSSKEYRKLLVIQQSLTQEEEKRAQVEQALAQIRQKAQEQLADTEGKLEDAIEKNIEAVERLHFLQRQQQAYMEANQTPSKFLEEDIDKQKSIVSQTEMNLEVISKIAEEERKKIGTTKEEISLQKQLAAIKEKIAKLEQKESFQKRDYKNARDADYQQWIDLQRQKDQLTAQLSAAGKNVETAREGFFSAQN